MVDFTRARGSLVSFALFFRKYAFLSKIYKKAIMLHSDVGAFSQIASYMPDC